MKCELITAEHLMDMLIARANIVSDFEYSVIDQNHWVDLNIGIPSITIMNSDHIFRFKDSKKEGIS